MTFELYDYGKTDESGRSELIATLQASSLDEAREMVKKSYQGTALYLYNEKAHGFVFESR